MQDEVSHQFRFSLKCFRLTAIKKALYRYSGCYFVALHQASDDDVLIVLTQRPSSKLTELPAEGFPGEVLDQELRETVAEETEVVRNIILAQAFSKVDLIRSIEELDFEPS